MLDLIGAHYRMPKGMYVNSGVGRTSSFTPFPVTAGHFF